MGKQRKPITNKIPSESKSNSSSKKSDTNKKIGKNLIAVIRIAGMVEIPKDIGNALYRLRLRRKYACVVLKPTKDVLGMIKRVKYYVAYGEIDKEAYDKLVKARGKKVGGKLKPFFRLHPPRGGIKSKLQYPKGVLGNNKQDINKLIQRML